MYNAPSDIFSFFVFRFLLHPPLQKEFAPTFYYKLMCPFSLLVPIESLKQGCCI